ncbi:hypothetical protein VPH35_020766 [Triticum aestivum]
MGDQEEEPAGFAHARHATFLEVMSSELPDGYATQEVNHLTLAYLAVAGLSLPRELDRCPKCEYPTGVIAITDGFLQGSVDHNCPGFDNDNFGISFDWVATGHGHYNPVIQVNPDFGYHHYFKVVKEHRVQWDPDGPWWFRLGGKPNFKEGEY